MKTYVALVEGKRVFEGSYDDCLRYVGVCNEYGWHIPSWMDASIVEKKLN